MVDDEDLEIIGHIYNRLKEHDDLYVVTLLDKMIHMLTLRSDKCDTISRSVCKYCPNINCGRCTYFF